MGEEAPRRSAESFLYETLTPLGDGDISTDTSASPAPTAYSSPSSPGGEEPEPYVVFRNEISLALERSNSINSAAPDYFSLDIGNEEADEEEKLGGEEGSGAPRVQTEGGKLEGKWFGGGSLFKSPMLRLHFEILDFCDFLSPTPEEQISRDSAIEAVSDVIKYIWPNAVVEVFGSFKTGLYLPSSDIDVVILGSNIRTPQIGLHALSKALSQRGIAKKIQVIAKAKVPIIKFVEKISGVAFDVSFDVDNGPKAAEFIKDAVSKWPPLKPLCLILKVFLQQRELNEVYTGGIGSYALLSMLMALLRTQLDRQASPEHNLGILLVNFFELYGCKLNTAEVGVSCNGRGIFFPKATKGFAFDGRQSLIAIEDPQAPENDIGKSSFNYYMARSAFAMAFSTLTNAKVISRLGPKKSILGAIIRPDAVLLERKGESSPGKLNSLFSGSSVVERGVFTENQDIYCNWPMNNEEDEEAFPRGNGSVSRGNDSKSSSGRKRKISKERKSGKKVKSCNEANGWANEHSTRKKASLRWYRDGSNGGSGRYGSWNE